MKKSAIITFLLLLHFFVTFCQEMDKEKQKIVFDFIGCIKYHKKEELMKKIAFPFKREYPIAPIKNKQEFLKRYNEVFDDSLTKMIVNSSPDKDWSEVGWRGIMLHNGQVWLDYDGRLLTVNYQSQVEKEKKEATIALEKEGLHPSLKDYTRPVLILETSTYRIRIDDMGAGNYRYASWRLKHKMSEQPDIILSKGTFIPEGSGGNHNYEFKSGIYTYNCAILVLGSKNSPPAVLTIYKNGMEILTQNARTLQN